MSKVQIAELKARCQDPEKIHQILIDHDAVSEGEDHQVDTYFNIPEGRLKLRQGNIENTLIRYNRAELKGIKKSNVNLLFLNADQVTPTKELLASLFNVLVVVDKKRKIYFIDNVKFHVDEVKGLGSFMEIEAIGDDTNQFSDLTEQCNFYKDLFSITDIQCIDKSYSDLILETN